MQLIEYPKILVSFPFLNYLMLLIVNYVKYFFNLHL